MGGFEIPQVKVVCRENGLPENGTPFPLCSMGGTNLIKKSHIRLVSRGVPIVPTFLKIKMAFGQTVFKKNSLTTDEKKKLLLILSGDEGQRSGHSRQYRDTEFVL